MNCGKHTYAGINTNSTNFGTWCLCTHEGDDDSKQCTPITSDGEACPRVAGHTMCSTATGISTCNAVLATATTMITRTFDVAQNAVTVSKPSRATFLTDHDNVTVSREEEEKEDAKGC